MLSMLTVAALPGVSQGMGGFARAEGSPSLKFERL